MVDEVVIDLVQWITLLHLIQILLLKIGVVNADHVTLCALPIICALIILLTIAFLSISCRATHF